MKITRYHPHANELMGYIPHFLREDDPRPAIEQLHENYAHGGGWHPFQGFTVREDKSLKYPGDPAYKPVACIEFREERIYIYEHAWVMVEKADGTHEVSRMD